MGKVKKKNYRNIFFIFLILSIPLFYISKNVYEFLLSLAPENYSFLRVGDKAPNFESICVSKDHNYIEKKVKLSDFKGKKLIFYFYPMDNTPFCTQQAKNLRDNYDELKQKGYEVLGVSTDNIKSHINFIREHGLPFELISDVDHTIHKKYGTWGTKPLLFKNFWKTYRLTFVINENGIITQIITKPKSKNLTQQILDKNTAKNPESN